MAKTKREYFNELKTIVSDNDALVAFIDHELELLDKKNSAPKAPTAKQVENEKIKDYILAHLVKPMTISEMLKDFLADYPTELSNQRVSAIVKQLVEDNSVVRTVEKRKAYFSVIA
jgi:hypothetical protein